MAGKKDSHERKVCGVYKKIICLKIKDFQESGNQITYKYDGMNRLIEVEYPFTKHTVYEYAGAGENGAGKIKSVSDAGGVISYVYGSLGEVVKESRTLDTHIVGVDKQKTAVMEYRSDYLGRMQSITYPDGEKVVYGYDDGGQVKSVHGIYDGNGNSFDYVTNVLYDERGQRARIEYGNGTSTDYTYDPARLWLESIKTDSRSGKPLQNIKYGFDLVGNVSGYTNDCYSESGNYSTSQSYTYDSLYQIKTAHGETMYNPHRSSVPEFRSTYDQSFSFDELGRMLSKVSSESVTPIKTIGDNLNYSLAYTYDGDHVYRLKTVGDRKYEYDSNGNIVLEKEGANESEDKLGHAITNVADGVYGTDYGWGLGGSSGSGKNSGSGSYGRSYTWDERNMLTSSNDGIVLVKYVYGQDGQRCSKYTVTGETLYFNNMWTLRMDGGNMTNGGQTGKNIYLGDTRIVTKLNSGKNPTHSEELHRQYFYHSDHLGSASLITDWEGNEYQRIEYTPYGETWVDKTSNTGLEYLPYKFSGKELDEETGLYYYGARYLDPKYSMWLSTDPALGEYIPGLDKDKNKNLPGMGGLFNPINANLFCTMGNNPVKYVDPDGRYSQPFKVELKLSFLNMTRLWKVNNDEYNYSRSFLGWFGIGQAAFDNGIMLSDKLIVKETAKKICGYVGNFSTALSLVLAVMPDPVGETKKKWDNFMAAYIEDRKGNIDSKIEDITLIAERSCSTEKFCEQRGLQIVGGTRLKVNETTTLYFTDRNGKTISTIIRNISWYEEF